MHHTIFDTPIVNTILRALSVGFLKINGWKVEGALPPGAEKSILIAAPHTSNWDLPFTLMVAFSLRLHVYWMGKAQLFEFPFRGLMMWLGGLPVQRERANNLVAASVEAIKATNGPLQNPVLENRFLSYCCGSAGAHRDGLYGLRKKGQWPGPGLPTYR